MIERDEVFRLKTAQTPGTLSKVLAAVAQFGGHVGEIETITIGTDYNVREVAVIAPSEELIDDITAAIAAVPGVEITEHLDRVFEAHKGGKVTMRPASTVRTLQDMRAVYTPGVARVSLAIAADPTLADEYTWKQSTVAVVSDGSRVLGLGNVGPLAALPVMEGKALFYSMFVGINAVPVMLATQDPAEIVRTVQHIAPGFGGIHLEDIASPGVYEIEAELDATLDIPVLHDDQHGTAVVLIAAVLSAARLTGRAVEDLCFGQVGLGAAGSAIALLADVFPFSSVRVFDPGQDAVDRVVSLGSERIVATASMAEVVTAADVLVLTTGRANLLSAADVRPGQIIMALSNPVPEIDRRVALEAGAAVATDGSIVNNVLAYPGLFRGALDARVPAITAAMKRTAAETLAELAPEGELLPDPLDPDVHRTVAARVATMG